MLVWLLVRAYARTQMWLSLEVLPIGKLVIGVRAVSPSLWVRDPFSWKKWMSRCYHMLQNLNLRLPYMDLS